MKYSMHWLCGGILLTLALLMARPWSAIPPAPAQVQSQGPSIERLQRLSQLVTLKVTISDVLIGESEGCRGSWLIRGDALLGIDLAQANIIDRDDAARRATLLLPAPIVLHPRVDHRRTKTWQVRRMAWLPWNADEDRLRDAVMQQAQELVTHAAGSAENFSQAQAAAESAITTFFSEVGWQVKVTWMPESANPDEAGHR